MSATNLQPAPVDPRRLRLTALTLVGVMVIGGILILAAYRKMAAEQANDTRPAIIHQIRKERDLRVIRQDGTTVDLFELRGKVVALHCLSHAQPETGAASLAAIRELVSRFAGEDNLRVVTLVIDPPDAGETVTTLSRVADQLGVQLPRWWVATNEAPTLHKFIRNELKTAVPPHQENGAWVFDTSVFLIDRNGHLRRAVIPQKRGGLPYVAPFDFDQAAEWDKKGVLTGTDRNNVGELVHLLAETTATLLAEPLTNR